ncbi:hypothetical protein LTS03_003872 [Exophiala xenobiotica]|uniref:Major facilitator superfamily (MFS) profile domain-containing protein n=1 Tax=Vermiconidia calcicola TaxID=1690605 RepID=A0AAV9Q873_9PEZI|nr:hypothetical protein LTS06_001631 [Exophiala xenobiotica]KAK5536078.1 hypothetical protein LTR25_005980 [Vermiconidia calcicola]KAK5541654.1 hypothetical protein LTR23_005743 [Chaetothyriales sp. CCFEE 6169]KAK5281537.1 hypothetical protein LTR40_004699 [Exophiala xenobiotica]KAK5352105.1 hypothetical protein LTR61_004355 [Exophiala xenobiotica]
MAEMSTSFIQAASDKRWYDYSELGSSRSNRYRTFLVVSMACIGQQKLPTVNFTGASEIVGSVVRRQWGGSNLTTYYQANILRSIGVKGQSRLLTYKAEAVSNLTIAFIFFVGIFHSAGINPLVVAYPVECLHTNIRAKGMGLNNFCLNVAEFVNTYGTPIGLKLIGWRIYIIYTVWNMVQALWVYVFFIETRGRPLEELDVIFEARHPVKESLKRARPVEPLPADSVKMVEG